MTATAGRFSVTVGADGRAEVVGPAAYMKAADGYAAMAARMERGESAVVLAAPAGTPVAMAVAVALQTDYAGWLGRVTFRHADARGTLCRDGGDGCCEGCGASAGDECGCNPAGYYHAAGCPESDEAGGGA